MVPPPPCAFIIRGPDILVASFDRAVGAKLFAAEKLTFPDSYFYRLFMISVLTLCTVRYVDSRILDSGLSLTRSRRAAPIPRPQSS